MATSPLFKKNKLYYSTSFLVLFLILSGLFTFYRLSEEAVQNKMMDFVHAQMAHRLQEIIYSRAQILTVLNNQLPLETMNEAAFHKLAAEYVEQFPEFYAINWVNPKGVIQWVFPESRNRNAKYKNLNDKAEVAPYLLQSHDEKQYVMSHVVELYQGPKGFVFYFPVFHKGFSGWINGVFTYEELLRKFIAENSLGDFGILISNEGAEFSTFEHGTVKESAAKSYKFKILNQDFQIYIAPHASFWKKSKNIFVFLMYVLALVVSGVITYLAYKVNGKNIQLQRSNTKLKFSNSIVSVLTHDFANQVFIVESKIKMLAEDPKDPLTLEKIKKAIQSQITTIKKVNEVRKKDFLQEDFKLIKVNLVEQVEAAIENFEQSLTEKKLNIHFKHDSRELYTMADPLYLQNSVLNNLLSNATKFSNPGSKIELYAFTNSKEVVLEIRDYGVGISKTALEELKKFEGTISTKGTSAEVGTGLGLLQVKTFTELFGSRLDIYSGTQEVDTGTLVILSFPTA